MANKTGLGFGFSGIPLFFEVFPGLEEDFLLGSVCGDFAEGLAGLQLGIAIAGQLLVQLCAEGFPFEHLVRYVFDDAGGISHYQASGGNIHPGFHEAEGAHDTACANPGIVHDDGIHTNHCVFTYGSAMDNGAMSDMGAFLEQGGGSREHVDDAIFLDIAACLYHNSPPIASEYGTRADVHIFSDDDIADDSRLRVHKSAGGYHRHKTFKSKKHGIIFFKDNKESAISDSKCAQTLIFVGKKAVKVLELHIESLIFAAAQPIGSKEIAECLEVVFDQNIPIQEIDHALERITEKYQSDDFAFEVVEIAGGYQFLTKGAYHRTVGQHLKLSAKKMLSKSALETLSIIAYKQPVSKSEVEQIRGVNCDYTVQKLLERELIAIKGRSDGPGRPLLYGTSDKFMDYFGLRNLGDLPKLKDFRETENQIGEEAPIEIDADSQSDDEAGQTGETIVEL